MCVDGIERFSTHAQGQKRRMLPVGGAVAFRGVSPASLPFAAASRVFQTPSGVVTATESTITEKSGSATRGRQAGRAYQVDHVNAHRLFCVEERNGADSGMCVHQAGSTHPRRGRP